MVCSPSQAERADGAHRYDFSAFHTFAFAGLTDREQTRLLDNPLMRKRIEEPVGGQLTAKGLLRVGLEDLPDPLFNFLVSVIACVSREKTGAETRYASAFRSIERISPIGTCVASTGMKGSTAMITSCRTSSFVNGRSDMLCTASTECSRCVME